MSEDELLPHRFAEGQRVALTVDHAHVQLFAGDEGVVWALYLTQPPSYEVEFRCRDGQDFSMVCLEDELTGARVHG